MKSPIQILREAAIKRGGPKGDDETMTGFTIRNVKASTLEEAADLLEKYQESRNALFLVVDRADVAHLASMIAEPIFDIEEWVQNVSDALNFLLPDPAEVGA